MFFISTSDVIRPGSDCEHVQDIFRTESEENRKQEQLIEKTNIVTQ